MEKFILPEKWCVHRTEETYEVINKWFKDNNFGKPYLKDQHIAICDESYDIYMTDNFPSKTFQNHTCITYDQFIKYVVNEEISKKQYEYDSDLEIIYKNLLNL